MKKNNKAIPLQISVPVEKRAPGGEPKVTAFDEGILPQIRTKTELDGVRQKVFMDRYSLKDANGEPTEFTPEEMWQRVAAGIAQMEKTHALRKLWAQKFYDAMEGFKFVPAGRILSGAGTGYEVTFFNCYVIPSPKDSRAGIMENITHTVEIQARGGGVGINLSSLRPHGARVKKVNGTSSGPVSWAKLYSAANHDVIQQGGCFSADSQVMTHLGLVPIREIIDQKQDWYVSTHKGYKKVTAKFDNGVKELYEVKTAAGFSVKITNEHKLLTVDNDGHFFLKELGQFKVGESTALLLGDWREDIPQVPLNSAIPTPSKFSYGRKNYDLPQTLDEKLAFLIGVYDADGSKIKDEFSENGKGIRIAVAEDRPKDLEFLVQVIKDLFGLEPKVSKGDGAVLNVAVYSRQLNESMVLNGLLKKSSVSVEVPQLIFNSPKRVVEAYIAGVFFGDGTNRGGKGGFRICTVSEKFAKQLQLLLINLSVASKIKIQLRPEENWKTLYHVTINGYQFMNKFYKFIKPFNEKADDNPISIRDGAFNWPFNLTSRFAYLSNFQRTIARSNPTTSFKAVSFLESNLPAIINPQDISDVEYLANTVSDKITSIEYSGKENVYDLEVEDVHLLSGNGFYTSNSRRGALMLMLHDWHPDIEEFIHAKEDGVSIPGANLSVCVSDKFMEALQNDEDWITKFPDTSDPEYDEKWDGLIETWESLGKKTIEYGRFKAREIWDQICTSAWKSAEPGLHFLERSNKWGNTWYFEKLLSTNPCCTGDTLVATPNGWRRADEIAVGDAIGTVLGGGIVDDIEVHENTAVYKVKFSDGAELRVTAAHQFHAIKAAGRAKNSANKHFSELMLSQLEISDVVRVAPAPMPDRAVSDLPEGWNEKDYGFFVGMILGDGCITEKTLNRNVVKMAVNVGEVEWIEKIKQVLQKTGSKVASLDHTGESLSANLTMQSAGGAALMIRQSFLKPAYSYGKEIPLQYQNTNREFLSGLLDGLFSTDGNVNLTTNHPQLRFKTTSKKLAEGVRRILLNFGIHGHIATIKKVADSSIDGRVIIAKHQQYEVLISGAGMKIFAQQIGLSHPDKQKRLTQALQEFALTGNTWLTRIVSIEEDGFETVYDLHEPISDTWITEGIVSRGCGEQPLGAWAVCNLGAMNLSAFVNSDGSFDYGDLEDKVRVAMRFMDNVVDANYYFWKENEIRAKDIRRTGIGTMGLGDALIKMKLRYGSEVAQPVIEKIYRTIRDASYDTSSDLAKEKGSFPKFDDVKYLQGHFIKQLPTQIKTKIKTQGIRNAVILTQAPTGTTSLLAGVSSGIEPVFDFKFIRRDRIGEHVIYHPLFQKWLEQNPGAERPDYFVGANDMSPLDHVKVQALIQNYTDSSISKTANAPHDFTVDQVKELYMEAYKLGCKGVTFFRDGSRAGVLYHADNNPSLQVSATSSQDTVVSRPMILRGRTYKMQTPVGEGFITINRDEKNQPFEVFITVGKGGMHTMADAEAMGRLVSLSLRLARNASNVDPKTVAQKIAAQLRGIGGASHVGFGKDRVMSLADAIAKALAEDMAISESGQENEEAESLPLNLTENQEVNAGADDVVVSQVPLVSSSTDNRADPGLAGVDLCPECGQASFVFEEGCKKCYSCGYSMC